MLTIITHGENIKKQAVYREKNKNLKYVDYLALAFYMLSAMTHWKMNKN